MKMEKNQNHAANSHEFIISALLQLKEYRSIEMLASPGISLRSLAMIFASLKSTLAFASLNRVTSFARNFASLNRVTRFARNFASLNLVARFARKF
jgi:hypothetical protein